MQQYVRTCLCVDLCAYRGVLSGEPVPRVDCEKSACALLSVKSVINRARDIEGAGTTITRLPSISCVSSLPILSSIAQILGGTETGIQPGISPNLGDREAAECEASRNGNLGQPGGTYG